LALHNLSGGEGSQLFDPFGTDRLEGILGDDVGDLVSDHRGQLIFGGGDPQKSFGDEDDPSRSGEGVGLFAVEESEVVTAVNLGSLGAEGEGGAQGVEVPREGLVFEKAELGEDVSGHGSAYEVLLFLGDLPGRSSDEGGSLLQLAEGELLTVKGREGEKKNDEERENLSVHFSFPFWINLDTSAVDVFCVMTHSRS